MISDIRSLVSNLLKSYVQFSSRRCYKSSISKREKLIYYYEIALSKQCNNNSKPVVSKRFCCSSLTRSVSSFKKYKNVPSESFVENRDHYCDKSMKRSFQGIISQEKMCNEPSSPSDSDASLSPPAEKSLKKKAKSFAEIHSAAVNEGLTKSRSWKYTNAAFKLQRSYNNGLDFTLMTYNVLSQVLLEDNPVLYRKCEAEHLTWEYRKPLLLKEITSHLADIICLQEVEEVHFNEVFEPKISELGYKSIYKKKTGTKCDGCAIFYKDSVFSLDGYKAVEYRTPLVQLLDRDNVGIVALLRPKCPKYEQAKICVATTHLLFNPKRGDVKLAQICILIAEIEKMAFKEKDQNNVPIYWPVLLCGDMNSVPYSPLYSFITKGNLTYVDLSPGDISGQIKQTYFGKVLTPLSIDLKPLGITCESRYSDDKEEKTETVVSEEPAECIAPDESKLATTNVETPEVKEEKPIERKSFDPTLFEVRKDIRIPRVEIPPTDPGYFCHGFNFISAYRHTSPEGCEEVTTINSRTHLTVDYIFYSIKYLNPPHPVNQKQACELQRLGSYTLLNSQHLKGIVGLPNSEFPSDHLGLITRLLLTP